MTPEPNTPVQAPTITDETGELVTGATRRLDHHDLVEEPTGDSAGGAPPAPPAQPPRRPGHGRGRPPLPTWQYLLLWGVISLLAFLTSFLIGRAGLALQYHLENR